MNCNKRIAALGNHDFILDEPFGTYTSQSKDLLTAILRNEFGFNGFIMTDWSSGDNPIAQMNAGNDLLMPGTSKETREIIQARQNKLNVQMLNRNVAHILEGILKTPEFKHYTFSSKPSLKRDDLISRWAATQGMILLKDNAQALPLKQGSKIGLFGNISYNLRAEYFKLEINLTLLYPIKNRAAAIFNKLPKV